MLSPPVIRPNEFWTDDEILEALDYCGAMTLLLSACLAASAASISHVRPAPHTYSGRVHAAAAVFGPAQERVAVKFTEQLGSAPADQHTGAISSLLDQQVTIASSFRTIIAPH